jgi:Na+-driven multidrug efflux pump
MSALSSRKDIIGLCCAKSGGSGSRSEAQEAADNEMANIQLCLAIGVPILFNRLLFVFGFTMLLTEVNHLETKFDANFTLLVGKLMEMDSRLSKVEAKLGL